MTDTCLICGSYVPEGRSVCPNCEKAFDSQKIIDKLTMDLRDCRNELCVLCGKYKRRHLGACDGCRWERLKCLN